MCRGLTQEGESRASTGSYRFSDGRAKAYTYAIRNRLEECVVQDNASYRASIKKKFNGDPKQRWTQKRKDAVVGPLLEGARKAFSAFVRAYPAKEKAVRHIFNASKWGAFRLWEGREAKFPIGSLQCGCNE